MAVQSAFSALRKEKNAAVREALNDPAVDGNTASIEVISFLLAWLLTATLFALC